MFKIVTISLLVSIAFFVSTGFHSIFGFWWVTLNVSALLLLWAGLTLLGWLGLKGKEKAEKAGLFIRLKEKFFGKNNVIDA